jgi:hypothetical protein
MKVRNLMFLALLAPVAQPVLAKPTVTYGPDALVQPSGFVFEPGGQAPAQTDQPKAEKAGKRKAEEPKAQREGRRKAEQPKAQKKKAPK